MILRPGGRKSAIREAQSAQNCHFCARKAEKWHFGGLKARKTVTSALGRPEKCHREGLPRTKTLILSSKRPKIWEKLTKKGQKRHFCPRKGLKSGKSCSKKDKIGTFVLESPENSGSEGKKRTKTLILSSKRPKIWEKLTKKGQKRHFCPQKPRIWRLERR